MSILMQRCPVAAEAEAAEGTAETIVDADVFLAFNPRFEPIIEAHERNPVRGYLSPYPSVFGRRQARMMFDAELAGAGAGESIGSSNTGSNQGLADALKSCGVSEALVASTSATYKPVSSSIISTTLQMFLDGKIYKMWGARGTARILLEVGKGGIISFEFIGADWSEADGALPAAPVYTTVQPPTFQGASLTIDSYAALVSRVEIDLGNSLAVRADANAASGNKSVVITDRKPKISFDPENVLVATEDFLGNWRNGTQMAFTTTLGAAAGNTIAVTAPKVQYQEGRMADRDGISIFELMGLLCINSGDDEWQIAIT